MQVMHWISVLASHISKGESSCNYTHVLMSVEAANAMAIVTASSLLMGNLLPLLWLVEVSSSSPVIPTLLPLLLFAVGAT